MTGYIVITLVVNFDERWLQKLGYLIVVSAFLQAVVGIFQVKYITEIDNLIYYNISYKRPYGIFGQVNLFATYIATGIGLSLYLVWGSNQKYVKLLLTLTAIPMFYALYLSDSRTAYVSLAGIFLIALVLLCYKVSNQRKIIINKTMLATLLLASTAVIVGASYFSGLSTFNDSPSTQAQTQFLGKSTAARQFIYLTTLEMIKMKPITGFGYGNFEKAHLEVMAERYHDGGSERSGWEGLRHPHNIILYLWVEGGLLPVLGFLLFSVFLVKELFNQKLNGLALSAAILPISLHLMTELPFSSSIIHIFVYAILLGFVFYNSRIVLSKKTGSIVKRSYLSVGFISLIFAVPYSFLYGKAYYDYFVYTKILPASIKRNAAFLLDANKVEGPLSLKYERARNELRYHKAMVLRDEAKIRDIAEKLTDYVQQDPNPNVYRAIVIVYSKLGEKEKAMSYYQRLSYLFPNSRYLNGLYQYLN